MPYASSTLTVRDWMRPHPIVTHPRDSIERARALCEEHRVNQLPVVSGGELVGIITDRDLRDAFPSLTEHVEHPVQAHAQTAGIDVEEVMTRQVLSVAETESVHAAASLLLRERIGALPVLRDKQLVGIVTRSDLLRALISLTTRATL